MAKFIRPVKGKFRVTDDYAAHVRRKSAEPGTDYGYDYGSPVIAPADATVVDVKHTNSAAMGRYVMLSFGGGYYGRAIHLDSVHVSVGDKVAQGATIGLSGGSAYGSNTGVGAHVHWTFWAGFHKRAPIPGYDTPVPWENYLGTEAPGSGSGKFQRKAIADVNRREAPNSQSRNLGNGLKRGDVGNFTGYTIGENVEGNNVWFRGHSGNWFWSGAFEGGSDTRGMSLV